MKHHYLEPFLLICKICIAKILLALCLLYVIEMITVYCLSLILFNEYTAQNVFSIFITSKVVFIGVQYQKIIK